MYAKRYLQKVEINFLNIFLINVVPEFLKF